MKLRISFLRSLLALIAITAVAGDTLADSSPDTRCWNARRGFASFSDNWAMNDSLNSGVLENLTADTVRLLHHTGPLDKAEFRFKVRNHHCSPGRRYAYTAPDGSQKKVSNPNWLVMLKGVDGTTLAFRISAAETAFDGISTSPVLKIESLADGVVADVAAISNADASIAEKFKHPAGTVDPTGALGSYKLLLGENEVQLHGGLHAHQPLLSMPLPEGFRAEAVGLALEPASKIEVSDMRLTADASRLYTGATPWDDPALLEEYLGRSQDAMEGYWQILDRSLEESLLKLGGDYRFAVTRGDRGYDLIYLSGAKVNSDAWRPGMIKATLTFSGLEGIYDVTWLDPLFSPIGSDVKAQLDAVGTLRLQFPYHSSTLRLHRTR